MSIKKQPDGDDDVRPLKEAPPLDSIRALEQHINLVRKRFSARERGRGLPPLLRALDWLRLYAYPRDEPDWVALERGRAWRRWMKDGHVYPLMGHFKLTNQFWRFLGPKDLKDGNLTFSGRVNGLAVHPSDSNTIYAGASNGGVWKTEDGGTNWRPLSDSWTREAIGSVAIDPSNPSTVYVGTGDFHRWSNRSFGLMKSEDGGTTFVNLAVAEAGEVCISSILVDPKNANVVLITGGRGRQRFGNIWRSDDAGITWSTVLSVSAEWSELVLGLADSNGVRNAYAVGWNNTDGLLYRSTDRGLTWKKLQPPWTGSTFSLSISASRLDPKTVYLLDGGNMRVYQSKDAADSWTDITSDLTQSGWHWNQAWYDWFLKCTTIKNSSGDPVETVFVGLKKLFCWDVKRQTWDQVDTGHDDQHCMAIDPADMNHLLVGKMAESSRLRSTQRTAILRSARSTRRSA